jgi:hypothetical protein
MIKINKKAKGKESDLSFMLPSHSGMYRDHNCLRLAEIQRTAKPSRTAWASLGICNCTDHTSIDYEVTRRTIRKKLESGDIRLAV